MNLGICLHHETQLDPGAVADIVASAEALGYRSAWVSEHTVIPQQFQSRYFYSESGRPPFKLDATWSHALMLLTYVAAFTTTMRLGTCVIPAFTRHPVALAKEAATVDMLSGGRLDLGLGAGWLREEAEILGLGTDRPMARLRESIDIMRKAWSQPAFQHDGSFWQIPPAHLRPHPVQGAELPIWIGGISDGALRTAETRGYGIVLPPAPASAVADVRERLSSDKRITAFAGLDDDEPSDAFVTRALAMRDAGADTLVIVARDTPDSLRAVMKRFAEDVMPAVMAPAEARESSPS